MKYFSLQTLAILLFFTLFFPEANIKADTLTTGINDADWLRDQPNSRHEAVRRYYCAIPECGDC